MDAVAEVSSEPAAGSVLIVDDEQLFARSLASMLRQRGYGTEVCHSADAARKVIARLDPDVVLMDLHLPDASGSDLMVELSKDHPFARFVIMTAHGSIRSAVEATQSGAVDYLTKPLEPDLVFLAVRNAMRLVVREAQARRLAGQSMGRRRGAGKYASAAMAEVVDRAALAAGQNGIVLLLGESGTGKDHLARWIHQQSARSGGPFFSINCAAVSPQLAESELFGHEPGAFTGTRGRKRGLLELAEQGTLLLDEIGELDLALQSKLLTFLDTRTFLRVGGERKVRVNARIFAATNRDLATEVAGGRFREDLYYRINVLPIRLPPLRERREDIPMLVEELIHSIAQDLGRSTVPMVEPGAMDKLQGYSWPGNVRELRNILERAFLTCDDTVRAQCLGLEREVCEFRCVTPFPNGATLHEVVQNVARSLIYEALRRGQTRKAAAALLGISRHSLAHQMRTLGIEG